MKLFLDNDVILDVILERPDFEYSQKLLSMIEQKKVTGFTSPIIFSNSFYIISRLKTKQIAWIGLKKIRLLLQVSTITQEVVDQALASDFSDFEDALQYYSAVRQKVDLLITRNKKHYTKAQIPVVSPKDFCVINFKDVLTSEFKS